MKELKFMVVGDGNVGKTSYIRRLTTGEFDDKNAYQSKNSMCITTNKGRYNIFFVETNMAQCTKSNINGIDAIILMFDISSMKTLMSLSPFMEVLNKYGVPVHVLINKHDLLDNNPMVEDVIKAIWKDVPMIHTISVKTSYNIIHSLISTIRLAERDNDIKYISDIQEEKTSSIDEIEILFNEISKLRERYIDSKKSVLKDIKLLLSKIDNIK